MKKYRDKKIKKLKSEILHILTEEGRALNHKQIRKKLTIKEDKKVDLLVLLTDLVKQKKIIINDNYKFNCQKKHSKNIIRGALELGDKKEHVTNSDLPFIISDVLGSADVQKKVNIKSYALTHAKGLKASTSIALELNGKVFEASSSGEGQYDAFKAAGLSVACLLNHNFEVERYRKSRCKNNL